MTLPTAVQYLVFAGALLAAAPALGAYMAAVYEDRPHPLRPVLGPLERGMYRLAGVHPDREMGWQSYAASFLAFSVAGLLPVYVLQRLQGILPLNPAGLGGVQPWTALNAAVSFVTNTNWQSYSGEQTMSYLTQMLGFTVQNFISAAAGMAVLVALVRGIARQEAETVGNFWVDLVRSVLYILLPLALVWSLMLAAGGVVQTFSGPASATTLERQTSGAAAGAQRIARGPVASQVAIKQLGTNGGGFFNTNSAHPFENPSPNTGFLELLAILLIPAALCHTFGVMVGDTRQGRAVFAAMSVVFVLLLASTYIAEQAGNPALSVLGVSQAAGAGSSGGNMEGKEVRFGVSASSLWAAATTAASNGSVNSMHDSFTPLGGMAPMWLIELGEVIYGGVGSGLYGMLAFVVIAVFISGLMVGRTPEYLGKKIEAFEMKMASLVVLVPAAVVLIGSAVAVALPAAAAAAANPGPHGFSEILYAFSSAGNNNGSAFAGLAAGAPFYEIALALAMLVGRFWVAVPILAMAGSLAAKKKVAASSGTLPTHRPLFVGLLVGVVILVGALTYIPALALGPIAEHLLMGA